MSKALFIHFRNSTFLCDVEYCLAHMAHTRTPLNVSWTLAISSSPGSHNCLKSLHNSQETVTHATVTTTQATPSVSLQVAATLSGCSGLYYVVFGSPPPLYDEVNRLNGIIEANRSQRTADLLPPSYEAVKDPSPPPSYHWPVTVRNK